MDPHGAKERNDSQIPLTSTCILVWVLYCHITKTCELRTSEIDGPAEETCLPDLVHGGSIPEERLERPPPKRKTTTS